MRDRFLEIDMMSAIKTHDTEVEIRSLTKSEMFYFRREIDALKKKLKYYTKDELHRALIRISDVLVDN